ncbi:MAG: GNAT family N-acetyltransferase [Thermomonas sp.]
MDGNIEHDSNSHRFTTNVDGNTAHVEYERSGDVMTITHTIVPSEIGGRGVAGELVKAALDHARAEDLKVVPQCSYADGWMRKHPDYEELRA